MSRVSWPNLARVGRPRFSAQQAVRMVKYCGKKIVRLSTAFTETKNQRMRRHTQFRKLLRVKEFSGLQAITFILAMITVFSSVVWFVQLADNAGIAAFAADDNSEIESILKERNFGKQWGRANKLLADRDRLIALLSRSDGVDKFNQIRLIAPGTTVNLRKVNLNDYKLIGINLRDAQLFWSKLRGTVLSNADLRGAYLFHCHCHDAKFMDSDLGPGSNNQKTVLGNAYLNRANFTGANLTRADFIDSSLTETVLDGAEIGAAFFAGSNMIRASLVGVTSKTPASFLMSIVTYADFTNADLSGANFRRAVLAHSDLTHANLTGADLQSAELRNTTLHQTNFTNAILISAILHDGDLSTAILRGADFTEAGLLSAKLRNVDLRGANFSDANADLADFSGADMRFVPMQNAALIGADLSDADLREANLANANLSRARLRGADLRGADLRGANLSSADLTGAKLEGALRD